MGKIQDAPLWGDFCNGKGLQRKPRFPEPRKCNGQEKCMPRDGSRMEIRNIWTGGTTTVLSSFYETLARANSGFSHGEPQPPMQGFLKSSVGTRNKRTSRTISPVDVIAALKNLEHTHLRTALQKDAQLGVHQRGIRHQHWSHIQIGTRPAESGSSKKRCDIEPTTTKARRNRAKTDARRRSAGLPTFIKHRRRQLLDHANKDWFSYQQATVYPPVSCYQRTTKEKVKAQRNAQQSRTLQQR